MRGIFSDLQNELSLGLALKPAGEGGKSRKLVEKCGGEIGCGVLGARAHDASDVELQPEESLRFVQQLLHPPPLLEWPNSNRRFEQKARVKLSADGVLQGAGQDVSDG